MYHIVKWIVYASQLLKSKTLFMSHVCTPLPSHPDLLFGYLLTKNSEIFERRLCFVCFVDKSFPENIFIDHLTNILLKFLPFYALPPESGGVLCYTLRNFECPSVRLSVCPSVRQRPPPFLYRSMYLVSATPPTVFGESF